MRLLLYRSGAAVSFMTREDSRTAYKYATRCGSWHNVRATRDVIRVGVDAFNRKHQARSVSRMLRFATWVFSVRGE